MAAFVYGMGTFENEDKKYYLGCRNPGSRGIAAPGHEFKLHMEPRIQRYDI